MRVVYTTRLKNYYAISAMTELKRLNKFISETGFCSRREADKYIEQGRVSVNGYSPELMVSLLKPRQSAFTLPTINQLA